MWLFKPQILTMSGRTKSSIDEYFNGVEGKKDLATLYEESFSAIEVGQLLRGTIVNLTQNEALVDVGYKSEGVLKLDEFSERENLKVGDVVDVLLEAKEDENGMIVLSKRKADRMKCWNDILENCNEGAVIEGKIFKKVRGGFMVDIGMEAFLPASLVDIRPAKNLDQFLGMKAQFKVVKINHKRKNIVLSRKDFLNEQKAETRSKMLNEIEVGQLLGGKVKNITDFGAFIDLGGLDGLLHITDMSWGRVSHPSEVLAIGDDVEVMVIAFDKESGKVSLGLKQKTANPWEDADTKYPVNSKVQGKVVNILPYGTFVELEKGIEGLVHISELSWTRRINHPSEMLAIGDVIEAIILNIDKDAKKIALGVKQTEVNPWLLVEDKYKVGDKIEGKVKNLTDYGAFVELEPGIGGLIHVSDMSWVRKISHPSEILKKGQKVEVQILSIDINQKKISLGLKQLENDPWEELTKDLMSGSIVSGTVAKVVNFGVFIQLENGLEGLVHISEIDEDKAKDLEANYKVGDGLQAMVIKVDDENRKLGLSLKLDLPKDKLPSEEEKQSGSDEETAKKEETDQNASVESNSSGEEASPASETVPEGKS